MLAACAWRREKCRWQHQSGAKVSIKKRALQRENFFIEMSLIVCEIQVTMAKIQIKRIFIRFRTKLEHIGRDYLQIENESSGNLTKSRL